MPPANYTRMIRQLQTACAAMPGIYLVGGTVRDWLSGTEPHDIDLVTEGSGPALCVQLANKLGANYIPLDDDRGIGRLITNLPDRYMIDICEMNGQTIEEDLSRRDFTINAMAVPLAEFDPQQPDHQLLDPLNGCQDWNNHILRACNDHTFYDDPLRCIRAGRFAGSYHLTPDSHTRDLIRGAPDLSGVAGERILAELVQIFNLPAAHAVVSLLDELGVWVKIFPETAAMRVIEQNGYHVDNVWIHCLNSLRQFETLDIPPDLSTVVHCYLVDNITRDRNRLTAVKLACLLHDVGKINTRGLRQDGRITFYNHQHSGTQFIRSISTRLRLSARETAVLNSLVRHHMNPLFLFRDRQVSPAAIYRFFRQTTPETVGCLLVSAADVLSTRLAGGHTDAAAEYADYIWTQMRRLSPDRTQSQHPLLSGDDIRRLLGLPSSPVIGQILERLREEQFAGNVTTPVQAAEFVRKLWTTDR